ncbi:MAG: transposase [Candidatus Omnitrophica bacterium]|nr:transposase [Candidatus Omnitrophota bacterium]MDD5430540.1 transposase [Candidatus Omnitrophota bacterium]
MSRPYRLQAENCLYHITSRGDDRKKIFGSEGDYKKFLEYLKITRDKYRFYLYAYCLMGNHYHLLLETTQPNISKIMQYLNTAYTVYCNVKRKRCGHLFQGRYKSIIVDADNYLLELTRYIHLNPVRAKIVTSLQSYKWSSYGEYIKKTDGGLIDKNQLSRYFKLSYRKYKEFVLDGMCKEDNPLSDLYAGFILGKDKFIKDTLNTLKVQVESEEFAYKKLIQGIDPEAIIQEVAQYYKKEPEVMYKAKKKPLLAKKVAIYLLKRFTSLSNKDIGGRFNIGYSGVSWVARDVERLMGKDKSVNADVASITLHLKV